MGSPMLSLLSIRIWQALPSLHRPWEWFGMRIRQFRSIHIDFVPICELTFPLGSWMEQVRTCRCWTSSMYAGFSRIEDPQATINPPVATYWQTIRPDLARWIYECRSVGGGINFPLLSMINPLFSHDYPISTPIVGAFHVGQCSLYAGVKGGQGVLITHGVYVTYPRCTGNT